jgi:hypothetical protein
VDKVKRMCNKDTARSDYNKNLISKYKYFSKHIFKFKINIEKSRKKFLNHEKYIQRNSKNFEKNSGGNLGHEDSK